MDNLPTQPKGNDAGTPISNPPIPQQAAGGPTFDASDVRGGLPLRFCFLQGWDILGFF